MKTRIISSLVALVPLLVVVFSGHAVLAAAVALIAMLGIHEFYGAVENAGYKPVKIIGYLACLPIFFIGLKGSIKELENLSDASKAVNYYSIALFAIIVILSAFIVFRHEKYNITDISLTVFGIVYVTFLFSFVVLTRNLQDGGYFIWLVFIGAFATDIFAYFTGYFLGKHKIMPEISPKKTWEGSIGGILGCVLVSGIFGAVLISREVLTVHIEVYHFIIIGFICGVISQIGDWFASAIKRYVKVKDYGKIMPGHGGVLDRFDSILFVAPVIYFYISMVVK